MINRYKKSEIPEGEKYVEIVKVTQEEVLGLVSGHIAPSMIMTTAYEIPNIIAEGDIFLHKDFLIQSAAAKMAPIDSLNWDNPLFKRGYQHNDLLLVPQY